MTRIIAALVISTAALTLSAPDAGAHEHGTLAFVSLRDGNAEIYTVEQDGSHMTRLTNEPASDRAPAWSPDGKRIAFTSRRDGNGEIYVMNADGSGMRRMTNEPTAEGSPRWSPDARTLLFTSNRTGRFELFSMSAADGSGVHQLTSSAPGLSDYGSYFPDRRRIVFERFSGVPGVDPVAVFAMRADGTRPTPLTDPAMNAAEPDVSPDGDRIAFVNNLCNVCGLSDVFTMKANGERPVQITHDFGNNLQPRWSPDGRFIAFVHDADGLSPLDVYVMRRDGSGPTNITSDPATALEPDWRPGAGH